MLLVMRERANPNNHCSRRKVVWDEACKMHTLHCAFVHAHVGLDMVVDPCNPMKAVVSSSLFETDKR